MTSKKTFRKVEPKTRLFQPKFQTECKMFSVEINLVPACVLRKSGNMYVAEGGSLCEEGKKRGALPRLHLIFVLLVAIIGYLRARRLLSLGLGNQLLGKANEL